MVTDITLEEARLLDSADNDFANKGKTDIECPRCGGEITTTFYGSSYTVGCVNDCISIDYRGI